MNIYSAKFMNEASATLSSKVFKNQANETYLFSALNILREMNAVIDENTKKMYVQIAEADSKGAENKIFADYFYQFRDIFQSFSNKIQEMRSRMTIAIENKMETYQDLIDDDQYIVSFDKEFSYAGWEFFHMQDADYPRLNLQKIYQKEFDYIGQLMQDNNGIEASSTAKLKVIATVSNNFVSASGDKDWIKCLIKDMVDIDDKEFNRSYSECIYNSLRDKYDINVNKGMLYTCKERLVDYNDIIDAACKLSDSLLEDLNRVAENISSYLFRNQDNKLKIKTDTDGIIDRDYRLDTYSMNQLDLFLKNKLNQIRKVLNVYAVAIGIKFDTAVDYISQNIEILQTAKNYYASNEEVSDDSEDDDIEKFDDDDDDTEDPDNIPDDLDDSEEKEPISEEEPKEDDDDSDDLGDLDDSGNDDMQNDTSGEDNSDKAENIGDVDGRDLEEAYLFESELFELEMMQEAQFAYLSVAEALMLEDEQPAANNNAQANNTQPSTNPNLQKLADQANVWQKIIQKAVELWNKFKEWILVNSKPKVEYITKNQKYLVTQNINGKWGLSCTPSVDKLYSITIPDLNYEAMKDDLATEDAFLAKYGSKFLYNTSNEGSVADRIKKAVLNEDAKQTGKAAKDIIPSIDVMREFCMKYADNTNKLKNQTNIIEKAQRVAKDVSKVQESYSNNNFSQYFTEDVEKGSDDGKPENQASTADKSKRITLYFKICTSVLAAEMTCYQKLFNIFYNHCRDVIRVNGGAADNNQGNDQQQNQTQSVNTNAGEVKFN